MPSLTWFDAFSTYQEGALPRGVWSGASLPTVATVGRNGGRGLTWHKNAMVRGGGGPATYHVMALKLTDGGSLLTPIVAPAGAVPSTLTSAHWLIGGSWNGFAYSGLCVTADGALHVCNGGAFENGPNSQDVFIVASSNAGVVPLNRGWFLLEAFFVWSVAGVVAVWVNGQPVLLYYGDTKCPGDFCTYVRKEPACPLESRLLWPETTTETVIGGATRGGQGAGPDRGWSGVIDFLATFQAVDDTDRTGDLVVADLLPTGDGATQTSTITGTAPASTRWQSLTDALTPDGDATTVTFAVDEVPALDEYALANLGIMGGTIWGVQPSLTARTSRPGYVQFRVGARTGSDVSQSAEVFARAPNFRQFAAPLATAPGGGAWDLAAVNAMTLQLERTV